MNTDINVSREWSTSLIFLSVSLSDILLFLSDSFFLQKKQIVLFCAGAAIKLYFMAVCANNFACMPLTFFNTCWVMLITAFVVIIFNE